jgi:hypothetical protein
VSYCPRGDAACSPGSRLPSAPGTDAAEIGQAILNVVFAAGLALNTALAMIPDGPAAAQVRRAIGELDVVIRELPRLVQAVPGPAAGPFRTEPPPRGGGTDAA